MLREGDPGPDWLYAALLNSANDAAIALYRSHDFVTISTRPRYYPDATDAVIMRCDLRVSDVRSPDVPT